MTSPPPKFEFVYREIEWALPENWEPNVHWFVEAYDARIDGSFPVGIAFCSIFPDEKEITVDFIFVVDHYRRQGVGRALIDAILRRWPNAKFTENPITELGRKFLSGLAR